MASSSGRLIGVADRFLAVLRLREVAVADDLHADDTPAFGAHGLQFAPARASGSCAWLSQTSSFAPSMWAPCGFTRTRCTSVQFGGGCGAQGRQAVTGDALGPNPLLLFGLVEGVHDALPLVGPAVLDHAMNEQAIHVVGVKHLAVAVDGREHLARVCRGPWTG